MCAMIPSHHPLIEVSTKYGESWYFKRYFPVALSISGPKWSNVSTLKSFWQTNLHVDPLRLPSFKCLQDLVAVQNYSCI